jgi:peroxiredoxin
MVLTVSAMPSLGTPLPAFCVKNVMTDEEVRSTTFKGKAGLLVAFISQECPYVLHIIDEFTRLAREAAGRGVVVLGIFSNDTAICPEDAPQFLHAMADRLGHAFYFCTDDSQAAAKALRAVCTPEFFLFDASMRLVYRGQFDDSRPGQEVPVTGRELRGALSALERGETVTEQRPSIGCSIKWRDATAS